MRTLLSLMPFRPFTQPDSRKSSTKAARRRRAVLHFEDLEGRQLMSTVPTIGDVGFETVNVGSGNFRYDPTGSPWNFSGYSGVSGNGSGFTGSNPSAPQGSQVGILQMTGAFSQSVANWSAGTYAISFDSAQRGNTSYGIQDFEVLVDNNVVGTFKPSSSNYQRYTTNNFSVTAGTHTIEFLGLDSAGGQPTAFIDAVSIAAVSGSSANPTTGGTGVNSDSIAISIQNALNSVSSNYGLSVQVPTSGLQYTTFTTANEPQAIESLGLPLRDGVTYYSLYSSSVLGASFGGITAGPSVGQGSLAVVVDPADPCVYVSAGKGTSFQFGVSTHGLIPFVPHASNYTGVRFSGQLWGSVQGLPVGDLPVSVSGDITINLNGTVNGTPLSIGKNASSLFTPGGLTQVDLKQIDVGVNGDLGLSPVIKGVGLSIPVYSGSYGIQAAEPDFKLIQTMTNYKTYPNSTSQTITGNYQTTVADLGTSVPGGYQIPASSTKVFGPYFSENGYGTYTITQTTSYSIVQSTTPVSYAFAGTTVNPLQGTALAGIYDGPTYSIQASSSGNTVADFANNFNASLKAASGFSVLGYNFTGGELDIAISSQQISVSANTTTFLGTDITLFGSLNLTTGGFALAGSVNAPNIPGDPTGTVAFYYNYAGHANGLYASITESFHGDYTYTDFFGDEYGFQVDASLTGTLFIGTDGSFDANLTASASGTIYLGLLGSYGAGVSANAEITNHSLSLSFNDGVGDSPSITFNY